MAIEKRPYFLFGDALAATAAGVLAALTAQLVPAAWPGVAAMLPGMIGGMLVGLLLGGLLVPLFGMESMPPAMLAGMVSGMVFAMPRLRADHLSETLLRGAVAGLAVLLLTYLLNAVVSGDDRRWSRGESG